MKFHEDQINTMKIRIGALERLVVALIEEKTITQRNAVIRAALSRPLRDPELITNQSESEIDENDFIRRLIPNFGSNVS